MLIAEDKFKERLNLTKLTRSEIEIYKTTEWFCPGCRSQVQIKNGTVKRPHFAHLKNADCAVFSENESEEHLTGKKLIATNCEKFGIPYKLEAYLPKLKQRPDVLIADKIAIEFQCSSLSLERFKERTLNYKKHKYQVIWVTGQQFHVGKQLSSLQKNFIYLSTKLGFYTWELDVYQKKIKLKFFMLKTASGLVFKEKIWAMEGVSICQIQEELLEEIKSEKILINGEKSYQQQLFKWNHQLNLKQPSAMKLQAFFYQAGLNLRELSPYTVFPSFLTPLLMEEELLLRFFTQQFFGKFKKGSFQEILRYIKGKMTQEKLDYVLIGEKSLLVYCLSFYLCFLKQTGKIAQKQSTYYLVNELKKCPQIKAEILWLPLKYVMIKK